MDDSEYKIRYQGSIVWLVVWALLFFPIAIMLFLTGTCFQSKGRTYRLRYEGSRFWLGFWVLVFFPIALILLFCKGAWVTTDENARTEKETTIILR